MLVQGKSRLLWRYAFSVLATVVALAVVAGLNSVVGFVPLLLVSAVALVEKNAGARPAILSLLICTVFSALFLNTQTRIHDVTELALLPAVGASIIYLMETRRMQKRVVHEQWLELSTLLESMTEAVVIFNSEGRVADVNRAAADLIGSTSEHLLGMHYAEMARLLRPQRGDEPMEISKLGIARALRGEVVKDEGRTLLNPRDGSSIDAVISATPMRVGNGRLIGALLVIRDVTELATLQRRIADTERHLAIGQMASGLAHDFNNVLNTITQATALLQIDSQSPEQRQRYLAMVDRAARTGAEIIRRVREYVRGGTGRPASVDVNRLMREALDLAEPMWRLNKNIQVETRFQQVSPVWANAGDLRRVFANLIINAIQAMPQGGRLMIDSEERDGRVVLRIGDTGAGIPPEIQKKIFLPYFTTKPSGTGLGLSTAQKILLAEHGNLSFQSEVGGGTTFTVELPAMELHDSARVPEQIPQDTATRAHNFR